MPSVVPALLSEATEKSSYNILSFVGGLVPPDSRLGPQSDIGKSTGLTKQDDLIDLIDDALPRC